MDTGDETAQPNCPTCSGPLVAIGSREPGLSEADFRRRDAYWCPAGCRGPEPDGTFELIACPSCGSRDTSTAPRQDGVEELVCNVCGTITSLQIVPSSGAE